MTLKILPKNNCGNQSGGNENAWKVYARGAKQHLQNALDWGCAQGVAVLVSSLLTWLRSPDQHQSVACDNPSNAKAQVHSVSLTVSLLDIKLL